jgi:hypothetical protein
MKLNRTKADLVPVERLDAWYARAILTPGLSGLDLALLSAIAGYHRQLQERGDSASLSLLRLAVLVHILAAFKTEGGRNSQIFPHLSACPQHVVMLNRRPTLSFPRAGDDNNHVVTPLS